MAGCAAMVSAAPETAELTLAEAARAGRRRFGTAVHSATLHSDAAGTAIITRECSSITPEWEMKWDQLAPTSGAYDFGKVDQLLSLAAASGMGFRGHTLLWHKSVPPWATRLIFETGEWKHVRGHIEAVVGRYRGSIDEWDVVNEPIDIGARADGLRDSVFMRAFGPGYIDWAFWDAHAQAPAARRFINEYGLEYDTVEEGRRRLALLRLLEGMLARGVPVNAVGLQAHLDLRKGSIYADGLYGLVRDLSGLGLEVAITELDVVESDTGASTDTRDRLVADEVRRYLDVVLQFEAVKSVTTWGLSDRTSWIGFNHPVANPQNRGLPYDAEWRRKPMHAALLQALSRNSMEAG
jgi:endo-1,4-beta-xylanase